MSVESTQSTTAPVASGRRRVVIVGSGFGGISAAKALADANVEAGQVGKDNAASTVTSSAPKPPRAAGEKVVDEGEGGNDIAKYLVAQKLI